MSRVVLENLDDELIARFDLFCKAMRLSRKELLLRYINRIVYKYVHESTTGYSVTAPANVPRDDPNILFVSDSDKLPLRK